MIKTEYGRFSAPFYQQKLDNGLSVIFLPRESRLNSALLYVPSGSYRHEESINGVKTPYGSAYVFQNLVLNEKRRKEFAKMSTKATSSLDYSYTLFHLDTLDDIFPSVQKLLDVFLKQDFTEEEIEEFKKENQESLLSMEASSLHQAKQGLLDNLYVSSSIKKGIYPSFKDVNLIHRSTLRNYVEKYAQANMMTLFISGNMKVEDVSKRIESLKVPSHVTMSVSPNIEEEPYDRVNHPYMEASRDSADGSYLSFGIKFPKRKELYEAFGQLLFEFYEILVPTLFSANSSFLNGVSKTGSRLVDSTLEQAGEDGYVSLTFKTLESSQLIRFLTDYCSKLEKRISSKEFKSFLNDYYASSIEILSSPNTALDEFGRVYANNLAYTGIVSSIMKMSFNTYRNFLAKMDHFPKAAFYLMKKVD